MELLRASRLSIRDMLKMFWMIECLYQRSNKPRKFGKVGMGRCSVAGTKGEKRSHGEIRKGELKWTGI